ncbi:MAG: hypothetical protein GXO89_17275 [Chlorobi bacterium]|nr:hypothetical protein [Chlorobiota bacterium]
MRITFITALLFVITVISNAQNFTANPKSWTPEEFLGFDGVGDCLGETGDISSVFGRVEDGKLLLRLTFDDMVSRDDNVVVADNFFGRDISLVLKINNRLAEKEFQSIVQISSLQSNSGKPGFLRTPESNMLEVSLDVPVNKTEMGDLDFNVQVIVDGVVVDEIQFEGKAPLSSGNCAFVQHGNQGLTYTDVFYGNPNGISGIDGSGYDEVMQAHEATSVPGNFHMSGTLMPAAEWHNPEFNDWLETMAANGLASMMTSALGQNIMPFAYNEMNDWSVYTESQMVQFRYNYTPRIAWVPERVWLGQGYYPDAGVIDWLGDNWEQHGIWGVVLDDSPHLNGYDNTKIHWMNNGSGVNLRVIPINNSFVGNVMYDANAAKNQIAGTGQYGIVVYGTDWEVSAEMNEHDGSGFLDNYENILWYCHDNYPAINVWKLEDAIQNPDFNGSTASLTKGTYNLLGGTDGYGGSNNSWYTNWAATPSHSDFHDPKWNYGSAWTDAASFLMGVTDNNLAQLGWYTLMINLHETGWHTSGEVADWEHRYSSHIKNANVYTEASRWADGQYIVNTACYFDDIDHDGSDELVMHNEKVFMVFEGIGGKANWVFYKNGLGQAYSVVSSDMAYWSETDGDYNETSSLNHFAALSDVWPDQQSAIYNITIDQSFGDTVQATLDQWGVQKVFTLYTGKDYLDVVYNFFDQTGYVKSGWSPDLLDILWSGKGHLQRLWGGYGSYCGYRNSANGASVALVLGNGGAQHNGEFEGTLVKGDEISGYNQFKMRMYAGYTSDPSGTSVPELETLVSENLDIFPPKLYSPAVLVNNSTVLLNFSEALTESEAEDIANYSLLNFTGNYTLVSAVRQSDWSKVELSISGTFGPGDFGQIEVNNVSDLNGNLINGQNIADLTIPAGITPHTVFIDGVNDFLNESELIEAQAHNLYITWDDNNLYIGFYSMDLNADGDLFVNIDTDQTSGSGATIGSWGRVDFAGDYLPEYQVAIEGGGGSMQLNNWDGSGWNYPGNGVIGNSYEGWSGNGLTEISIPWANLGNPLGIAVSVHISEEDSQVVPEIYPGLNTTASNPTITYFYAFFQPYILGDMPLTGMEPNAVYVVPNTPATIVNYSPLGLSLSVLIDSQQIFSVTANDSENDEIYYIWKMDGATVGSLSTYLYEPVLADVGNHSLMAIVSDNVPGNDADTITWNVEVIEHAIQLSLKVFLEGPFSGTEMHSNLNSNGVIPLQQPYSGSPWNYAGTESVVAIPGINNVDWVLVELRDAVDAASAGSSTMIALKAAFVRKDGTIVGIDGSPVMQFNTAISQQLFVVVWHRDHLAIISANALVETAGVYDYDFSTSSTQVLGGAVGYKEIATGIWGMVAGDSNADGIVDGLDKTENWTTQAGLMGYYSGDYGLDSEVDNKDKNEIWMPNSGMNSPVSGFALPVYKSGVPE